ncbi:mannose-1-phosphate guanylyltransferase/mannose-6-phosphate isomerase [Sinorhizobium fredii]|uniref:mannose-1-phosphate guanylyltransferase n=1 Tax=Rhizobium fredii TaxID=380 RepID=A0A2A6M6X2_RHIFR|nr:mannose-1-phosphate guanylyltransferase/mannose-6-phosphate isomerase [Sinorhizobium fredii]PDT50405.1 mannose-1-phosphate guanylyltransferase/mannose-6-phosphate isomerase [Sinorhizobium fredii]
MAEPIVPVILAGGRGTRLWPMSRTARPKQFLSLTGAASLFQQTLLRSRDASRYRPPLVLTHSEYRFIVAEQAQEVDVTPAGVLLEPIARNTAAAVAAAAAYAVKLYGPGSILHVLPSDHATTADADYWRSMELATNAAATGRLVAFGVVPVFPETGYGYIKVGPEIEAGVNQVARFVEKPSLERAESMLAEGGYLWNSGMFMLGAQAILDETHMLAPETYMAASSAIDGAEKDLDFVRIEETAFARAPDVSIDYAIFEKTKRAVVVAVSSPWSDLGAWDAVWKVGDKDEFGNVARGAVTFSRASSCLVISERAHVVAEGVDGLAVIASEDAVFVGKLSDAQKIGSVVKSLEARPETKGLTEIHKTVHRPWGGYSSILNGDRFQVRRLFVKPGKMLSLQRHHHRAEHWVVVRGTAEVTVDARVEIISENQSIYLPLGCAHRLANPGKILLEVIEVQTGSYFGEDDIVRIEDEFGRA